MVLIGSTTFLFFVFTNKMFEKDKITLTGLTVCLDVVLLGILFYTFTRCMDKALIIATLVIHLIFLRALRANNRSVLDVLHVFVFVIPLFSLFVSNVLIKCISVLFLIVIQYLWLTQKRCILKK